MNKDRFKLYLEKQKKAMDDYKWQKGIEICRDPGEEAIKEWIAKYAKKFRKEFVISDFKEALSELKDIRKHIQEYLDKISTLNKIIDDCESKILEGLELFDAETLNGNGK